MGGAFTAFLFVLILLAIFTRETFVVILLYLFVGVSWVGRWWTAQIVNHLAFHRRYIPKAFPGETVSVQLDLTNTSILPAVWLRIQDLYPLELADTPAFAQIISLGPRETTRLTYQLKARKRGYYPVGPLQISSGDLLGLAADRFSSGPAEHLTVYPRVITFDKVRLPSNSPLGTLRHTQPVFEDPTRSAGKRDYMAGDSLRRIDWKSTASLGRLQTKQFEPSIALETALFLNLNLQDYDIKTHFDATELAIVVTASLANWVIAQRQSAGLTANGIDPLAADNHPMPLAAGKGRVQMMRILETLARIRTIDQEPFTAVLRRQRIHLTWGATLIVITGSAEQDLLDELLQSQRVGLNPVLILCGEHPRHRQAVQQARQLKIPVELIRSEYDLHQWTR